MSSTVAVPPQVTWAQRKNLLYVIINVECKDIEYNFTDDTMHFKGTSIAENKQYEVTLNFLKKINPAQTSSKNIGRCLEFTISKAESGPYWASLTTDKKKPAFLKVDFHKWADEDDKEEDGDDLMFPDFSMGDSKDKFEKFMQANESAPSFDLGSDEEEEDSEIYYGEDKEKKVLDLENQ